MAAFFSNYVLTVSSIIICYYFIVQAVFHHEDELRQQAKKMNVTSRPFLRKSVSLKSPF
jgi:r-opsin